jgi:hypothetical protein
MFAPPVTTLLIIWAAITSVLAVLLAYRTLIGMKEDDQLFLDPAESNLEAEQKQLLIRLARLSPYIKGLSVASCLLLLGTGAILIYRGLHGLNE